VLWLLVTAIVVPSPPILVTLMTERIPYLRSVLQLQVTANAVPSSLIRFTLVMEAKLSSETSVFA
jgi:hypothetical protein